MKILYDDNMPYAHECFNVLGDAHSYNANTITPHDLNDVDALICRSTLKVNRELLSYASHLKLVATATAGFNHLDIHYLQSNGIPWYSAAGCNAVAVAEYVISALFSLKRDCSDPIGELQKLTVGIVGAGNVGTALSRKLDALNIRYLLCDPPLENTSDERDFVSLDSILETDIICLHVPLIKQGEYPTENLLGLRQLEKLTKEQVIINACRGGVIDEKCFLTLSENRAMPAILLDAWCDEPSISPEMLKTSLLATPHIAGHSLEGKARGTFMAYEALSQTLDKNVKIQLEDVLPSMEAKVLTSAQMQDDTLISQLIFSLYDIQLDDRHFRRLMAQSDNTEDTFMKFRANYAVRREFSAQQLVIPKEYVGSKEAQKLERLGFKVVT